MLPFSVQTQNFASLRLEQSTDLLRRDFTDVTVSRSGSFTAAGSTHDITFLDQEWLVYFFDGFSFFAAGGCNGGNSNWTTFEFLNDRGQDADVHIVEAVLIHI